MSVSARALQRVYALLLAQYGPQRWWPARTAFEMMAGAILTQNTSWTNVEHALSNLRRARALSARGVLALDPGCLRKLIRPAGYFNLKSERLRAISHWLLANGGHARLGALGTDELRGSLLGVNGVGPETADSILLYAFERPVFVVDAYTRRMFSRLGVMRGTESYDTVRAMFESRLESPAPLYNEYHALIVRHAKEVCRTTPRCAACCLRRRCRYEPNGARVQG